MSASRLADQIAFRLSWEDLDTAALQQLIHYARQEDLAGWGLACSPGQTGDVTSQVLESQSQAGKGTLVAREDLVVCGLNLVQLVLDTYGEGAVFKQACPDGSVCRRGTVLGQLEGPTGLLLESERVLLNFLQKLSGVATQTSRYVECLGDSHTRLLDTRKTTPGYRVLEKYAVGCGGGFNHRIGLFDRVMLKDNHLAADRAGAGDALAGLVRKARAKWPQLIVELEVDRLDQIQPALEAGVDVLLLDNFPLADLKAAVQLIGTRAATEASGGITMDSLPALARIGLDFISTGATIHQSTWKDVALDWS